MSKKLKGKGGRRCFPYRNKMELQYSQYLDSLKAAGKIHSYRYEAVKFSVAIPQVGKEAVWTPDFYVVVEPGVIELHEVKGFFREASLVRTKVVSGWCGVPVYVIRKVAGAFVSERI